jgi:hypothetical protein
MDAGRSPRMGVGCLRIRGLGVRIPSGALMVRGTFRHCGGHLCWLFDDTGADGGTIAMDLPARPSKIAEIPGVVRSGVLPPLSC